MKSASDLVLDLEQLPNDLPELDPRIVDAVALAASVVLDAIHGATNPISSELAFAGETTPAWIRAIAVDDRARRSWGDWQEAVENAGEAIALATAGHALERAPFARLPKATGADYLVRRLDVVDGDQYERLECSGIASKDENVADRLRSKLRQMARYEDGPPGFAIVTHFGRVPVQVAAARWPR